MEKEQMKAGAAKVAKLREQAKDKSLPQEVRNQLLDKAVMMEVEAAKKAGVKMAKGGAVAKKMMGGGYAAPMKKAMAKGGAVAKKAKK